MFIDAKRTKYDSTLSVIKNWGDTDLEFSRSLQCTHLIHIKSFFLKIRERRAKSFFTEIFFDLETNGGLGGGGERWVVIVYTVKVGDLILNTHTHFQTDPISPLLFS